MNQWQDSAEADAAIGKAEARPLPDESGLTSPAERKRWLPILDWFKSKFRRADDLAEEFGTAKVAKETNTARKTIEEAGEIAARREKLRIDAANETTTANASAAKDLAEANKLDAEAEKVKQDAIAQFLDNIDRIATLPENMQAAAMEKLLPKQPDVAQQLERVENLLEELRWKHGLSLTVVPDEEPVAAIGAAEQADQSEAD